MFDRTAAWYTDIFYKAPMRLLFDKAAELGNKDLFGYAFREVIPTNDPMFGGRFILSIEWYYGF